MKIVWAYITVGAAFISAYTKCTILPKVRAYATSFFGLPLAPKEVAAPPKKIIKKILAFNPDDASYVYYEQLKSLEDWKIHQDNFEYAEVRYEYLGCKYRQILYPGGEIFDADAAPPPPDPFAIFKIPLRAQLINVDFDRAPLDLTKRYLKYAGPSYDYHGADIAVRQLYPFDMNFEEWECLRVDYLGGKTLFYTDFGNDPLRNPPCMKN